jgi:hypothetical protein
MRIQSIYLLICAHVCVCVRLSGFEIAFYHISPRLFKEICQSLLKNSASNNNKTKQKRNNKHKKKVLIKKWKQRRGGGSKLREKKILHTAKAIPHFSRGHVASRRFFFQVAPSWWHQTCCEIYTHKRRKMKFFKNKRSPFLGRESVTGLPFFLFKLLLFFYLFLDGIMANK